VALQRVIAAHIRTAQVGFRKRLYWAPFFLSAMGRPA